MVGDRAVAVYPGGKPVIAAKDVVFVAPGDYDNDGLFDLLVIRQSGVELYRDAGGKYEKVAFQAPAGKFERALWIDYDHDNDMDLVLLGENRGAAAQQRNGGVQRRDQIVPVLPRDMPSMGRVLRFVPRRRHGTWW